jgi:hypothetical protein
MCLFMSFVYCSDSCWPLKEIYYFSRVKSRIYILFFIINCMKYILNIVHILFECPCFSLSFIWFISVSLNPLVQGLLWGFLQVIWSHWEGIHASLPIFEVIKGSVVPRVFTCIWSPSAQSFSLKTGYITFVQTLIYSILVTVSILF